MKKQKENQVVDGDKWFEDSMNNEKTRKSKKQPQKSTKKSNDKPNKPKSNQKRATKPGVILSIMEFITKYGPISKDQIHRRLVKRFPDRNPESMKKTIACQVSGKKRPLRMEKERGVKFDIDKDGRYSLKNGKK